MEVRELVTTVGSSLTATTRIMPAVPLGPHR